jgi:hypothetical protein
MRDDDKRGKRWREMGNEDSLASLAPAKADYVVLAAKAALGAVPFAGALLGEIAGSIIPNQRIDRIARFANALEQRLTAVEEELVRSKLSDESFTDLAEEALRQAARATSDDRLGHIADIVANSITDESLSDIEAKHLLSILGDLNDIEVIRLGYHATRSWDGGQEYYQKHENVLAPAMAYLGSSQEEADKQTLQRSYDQHLARLGLLEPRYKTNREGLPEFDKRTGVPKISGYDASPLGRFLSRQLGLTDEAH